MMSNASRVVGIVAVMGIGMLGAACRPSPAAAPAADAADRIAVPVDVLPRHGTLLRGFGLAPSKDGNYDGWFGVGPLTTSPPAALLGQS
jgi:hypothetical protein